MSIYALLDDTPFIRPSRIMDQCFGHALQPDDFFQPLMVPRLLSPSHTGYLRPWRSNASEGDAGSTVHFDKDKFQANLDVQQFRPDEISVKVTGENTITVEGKHEEKQDEHGYISRQFVRRYVLPKNCDIAKVESKLSSDGVLTITAPTNDAQIEHKSIPITQTGEPVRKIKQKKVEDKNKDKKMEQ